MTKGIVLIATGAPIYGRMAYVLATTIKAMENVPICIVTDDSALLHLTESQQEIFDIRLKAPALNPFELKVNLYDLSPFDYTLYLDADMVWLPKRLPSQLFSELAPIDFTALNEGYTDLDTGEDVQHHKYHNWCDLDQAKKVHSLAGRYYRWRTELIYFKKGAEAKKIFSLARKMYKKPGDITPQMFVGGVVPDELAFNLACCKMGVHPHVQQWVPAYWARIHKPKQLPQLMNEHYTYSAGGNWATPDMQKTYNTVAANAHKSLGVQYLFTLQSKKSVLRERQKI